MNTKTRDQALCPAAGGGPCRPRQRPAKLQDAGKRGQLPAQGHQVPKIQKREREREIVTDPQTDKERDRERQREREREGGNVPGPVYEHL